MAQGDNPNPEIHTAVALHSDAQREALEEDEDVRDPVDALEVYELLRGIKDPEHPNSLEQLRVVNLPDIHVDDERSRVKVLFTPTVPHCSMTTLIGLCIRVKLMRCMPARFKIDVRVAPGTHDQEVGVNKQLADKERVAAALENNGLLQVVSTCLADIPDSSG
uniref:MIP18 family-like domain-containing protein n=1 Tax=Neobodo designis TaxID=312471 RepID=A0A7S1W8Y5_NEODS